MILFVCNMGLMRSRTAEVLATFAGISARSVGVSPNAPLRINKTLLKSAEKVVCMDSKVMAEVCRMEGFVPSKSLCLDVKDAFHAFDPVLIKTIIQQMRDLDPALAELLLNGHHFYSLSPSAKAAEEDLKHKEKTKFDM